MPNWLSTHPDPGSRVGKAKPVAGKFASADGDQEAIAISISSAFGGLVFGDNPKDGIVRGNEFLHPLLRLGVEFPEGWEVINSPEAVMAQRAGHRALHGAAGSAQQTRQRASIGDAAVAAMRSAGYSVVDGRIEQINGQDAHVGVYRGTAKGSGKVMMRAAHIAVGRQFYVVAGFAPEADFALVDREVHAGDQDVPPADAHKKRRPSGPTGSTSTW